MNLGFVKAPMEARYGVPACPKTKDSASAARPLGARNRRAAAVS